MLISVILIILLCSCDFSESDHNFEGGELLDNEKLSEIKDKIFTEESDTACITETEDENSSTESEQAKNETTSSTEVKKETEKSTEKNTEKGETASSTESAAQNDESDESETPCETDSDTESLESDIDTEGEIDTEKKESEGATSNTEEGTFETVYWTKSGTKWHLFIDCSYIKNSENVLSGTVEEAIEAKKEGVCKRCDDRAYPK